VAGGREGRKNVRCAGSRARVGKKKGAEGMGQSTVVGSTTNCRGNMQVVRTAALCANAYALVSYGAPPIILDFRSKVLRMEAMMMAAS
jgi:hypothetical protein